MFTLTSNQPATDWKVPITPSGFKNSLEWLLELRKVLHFHYSFIVTDKRFGRVPNAKLPSSSLWNELGYVTLPVQICDRILQSGEAHPSFSFQSFYYCFFTSAWLTESLAPQLNSVSHHPFPLAQNPNFLIQLIVPVWPVPILSHLLHINSVWPSP